MWDDELDERMSFERDLDAAYAAFGTDYFGADDDEETEYYRDLLDELGE